MFSNYIPLLAGLMTFLAGCTAMNSDTIQYASMADVKGCVFLGDVEGSAVRTQLDFHDDAMRLMDAESDAIDQAVALNATHIVWGNRGRNAVTFVTGKAYKCEKS